MSPSLLVLDTALTFALSDKQVLTRAWSKHGMVERRLQKRCLGIAPGTEAAATISGTRCGTWLLRMRGYTLARNITAYAPRMPNQALPHCYNLDEQERQHIMLTL